MDGSIGAGQLACEAMATICNAMSRLEVGEISVASFGEEFQLLHSFDDPFTADSGASILSNFTFAQEKTDMPETLRLILQYFETARRPLNTQGQTEYVQLAFLISDGRFEDSKAALSLDTCRGGQAQATRCALICNTKEALQRP